jgi:hypothetical protein
MNLFRSATQYDAAVTLFAALEEMSVSWYNAYAQLLTAAPAGHAFVIPWQARVQQTGTLLEAMRVMLVTQETE